MHIGLGIHLYRTYDTVYRSYCTYKPQTLQQRVSTVCDANISSVHVKVISSVLCVAITSHLRAGIPRLGFNFHPVLLALATTVSACKPTPSVLGIQILVQKHPLRES